MWYWTRKEVVLCFYWLAAWASVGLFLHPHIAPAEELIVVVKGLEAGPYEDALRGFKAALAKSGFQGNISEYTLKGGEGNEATILAGLQQRRPTLILTL